MIFTSVLVLFCASLGIAEPLAFDSLEYISPVKFQNKVIRYERALHVCKDTAAPDESRQFACAASLYYGEHWKKAYKAYDSLRGKDSLLDQSILIRMARTRLYEGKLSKVNKVLHLGKKMETDREWQQQADRIRMETFLANTDVGPRKKADSIEIFLKKYPSGSKSNELRFRRATLLEKAKKWYLAQKAYIRILSDYSEFGDSALIAVQRIRQKYPAPETLDEKITYANRICSKGIYNECVSLIDSVFFLDSIKAPPRDTTKIIPLKTAQDSILWRLPPSTLDIKTRINLWEKKAFAFRNIENKNQEAIAIYRFLLDSVEVRAGWMQSLLRLLRREKRTDDVKIIDSLFQVNFKFSTENANNLWVRGLELEQNRNYNEAIATYAALTDTLFGNTNKRQWAKFRIGFVYFKQGLYSDAEKYFLEASKEPFTWSSNASRMFLADTYLKQGKDSLAREMYLDCIRDFPLSYYAQRSRNKLIETKLLDSTQIPFLSPLIVSEDSTLAWIRSVQPQTKQIKTYTLEKYYRIKHLLESGFIEEAYDLYTEESKKNYAHLDFLYEYGTLFLELGELTKGYQLAREFQNLIDRQHMGTAPLNVLRFVYPLPYREKVSAYSDSISSSGKIDPFFVYSVMRQESGFNSLAISRAGARGLLQIMPATGAKLAARESLDKYIPSLLFNPYMNIRLGIRYLKDLFNEYDGDYMYVLCNYNAGPKPTKRWVEIGKGLDWDIHVEEISYWETRDYVKRVLGNYWIYQEVWNSTHQ